ncbi:MAG: VOC family protein [Chloroflexota bacterium]
MLGQPTRPGFQSVTPYLVVRELEPMIDFLKASFGASELFRAPGGGGGTHVELRIGNSVVMIGGGEGGAVMDPMPTMLFLYLEDVDKVYHAALSAGATSLAEPGPMFGEPRGAGIKDPSENQWYFARWEVGPNAPPQYDKLSADAEPSGTTSISKPKQIEVDHFSDVLYTLLDETFDNVQGIYLDKGTSMFETLATISAEEASIPVGGKCATLAAQVKHVTFYLDVLEEVVRTQQYVQPDWDKIWRETTAVTPKEWDAIQTSLRDSYDRIKKLIADTPEWPTSRHIGGAIGIIAHTAYHLGEIRQALCVLK